MSNQSNGKTHPAIVEEFEAKLTGDWKGFRECHITPDWLLVYKKENNVLVLTLTRLGSHSDLNL